LSETDEAGVVSRFGYDALGRLIGVTNAYDRMNRLLQKATATGLILLCNARAL